MKVYDLGCEHGHRFEGWFGSAQDFESQQARGLIECPLCASHAVRRLPSAARLNLSHAGARIDAAAAAQARARAESGARAGAGEAAGPESRTRSGEQTGRAAALRRAALERRDTVTAQDDQRPRRRPPADRAAADRAAAGAPRSGRHEPDWPPGAAGADAQALQAAWLRLTRQVIAATEDVGERFADEARRIHHDEAPARPIRGVTTPRQAAELAEEGIEVVALPLALAAKEPLQ